MALEALATLEGEEAIVATMEGTGGAMGGDSNKSDVVFKALDSFQKH